MIRKIAIAVFCALALLFVLTHAHAQSDPSYKSINLRGATPASTYYARPVGTVFYDNDSGKFKMKDATGWFNPRNGSGSSIPSNVLKSNFSNVMQGNTSIYGPYKFDVGNSNAATDTAYSWVKLRSDHLYIGSFMKDESLGSDAWGRIGLYMKPNYGGSIGQPNVWQISTNGNYTSDSTYLEVNDTEPTIRLYSTHMPGELFRFDPNNAVIYSPYFSWGNGTGSIDNTHISNSTYSWNFPAANGTFAMDDKLFTRNISFFAGSPGTGEDGKVLFWDNLNQRYDLKAVSGGISGLTTGRGVYATSSTTVGDDAGFLYSAANDQITSRFLTTVTSTLPGLNLGTYAGDPSTLTDGDMWHNAALGRYRLYHNTQTENIVTTTSLLGTVNGAVMVSTGTNTGTVRENQNIVLGTNDVSFVNSTDFSSTGKVAIKDNSSVGHPDFIEGQQMGTGRNQTTTDGVADVAIFDGSTVANNSVISLDIEWVFIKSDGSSGGSVSANCKYRKSGGTLTNISNTTTDTSEDAAGTWTLTTVTSSGFIQARCTRASSTSGTYNWKVYIKNKIVFTY